MKQALADFAARLDAVKVPYGKNDTPGGEVLVIPCAVMPNENTRMVCMAPTEKNDIVFRVNQFVHMPIEKRSAALEMMNTLNSKYRHVRFMLDDDNDVHLCMEMPAETENPGDTAMEYFGRALKIMKDCYPDLMRMVWKN